jgi:hypothetical protein
MPTEFDRTREPKLKGKEACETTTTRKHESKS